VAGRSRSGAVRRNGGAEALAPYTEEAGARATPVRITVSGEIAEGPTPGSVTYFVIDAATQAILGDLVLPDAGREIRRFRIPVHVARQADAFDVGLFDDAGHFVSAGFAIEAGVQARGTAGTL